MNTIKYNDIINIFQNLNLSKMEYLLIRNINNELPYRLKKNKDIDLLVKKCDIKKINEFFRNNGYYKINHPYENNIYLYGADRFCNYYNSNNGILFDLHFQILVRSLDAGQWIPIDKIIQKSAWQSKRYEKKKEDFEYWTLGFEDEYCVLIARSIFDKKEFQDVYINRIEELYNKINPNDVFERLSKIFFKFTPYLIEYLSNKEYNSIINNYISFKEY